MLVNRHRGPRAVIIQAAWSSEMFCVPIRFLQSSTRPGHPPDTSVSPLQTGGWFLFPDAARSIHHAPPPPCRPNR
jgi:hypothetical protein